MFTADRRTEQINKAPCTYALLKWAEAGEVAV
jgi:hypothetical protein